MQKPLRLSGQVSPRSLQGTQPKAVPLLIRERTAQHNLQNKRFLRIHWEAYPDPVHWLM